MDMLGLKLIVKEWPNILKGASHKELMDVDGKLYINDYVRIYNESYSGELSCVVITNLNPEAKNYRKIYMIWRDSGNVEMLCVATNFAKYIEKCVKGFPLIKEGLSDILS